MQEWIGKQNLLFHSQNACISLLQRKSTGILPFFPCSLPQYGLPYLGFVGEWSLVLASCTFICIIQAWVGRYRKLWLGDRGSSEAWGFGERLFGGLGKGCRKLRLNEVL